MVCEKATGEFWNSGLSTVGRSNPIERITDTSVLTSWYVLETKRHYESRVAAHLQETLGITVYEPRMRLWPPPAVGKAIVPVFPRYVFALVHLPTQQLRVSFSPGVKDFVRLDRETPAVVPPEVIETLKRREGPDGLLRCDDDDISGTRLKISRGPFRDLYGVLQARMSGRDRVVLLIDFLQRQIRVEVPGEWLKRA